MPPVSIIIPTYNRAKLLPLAIESVQAQTHPNWELIIVDDGSTDGTATIVAPFLRDGRIRYVQQINAGRSAARNHGARLAQHDWLIFLDSDDELTSNALAHHLAAANGADMTIGGVDLVDTQGQLLRQRQPWQTNGSLSLDGWLFDCYGQPSSVMVRRNVFARVGGFKSEMEPAEDWKLYLDLAAQQCQMAWTHASVCRYRLHDTNSIHDIGAHTAAAMRVLQSLTSVVEASQLEQATTWMMAVAANRALLAGELAEAQTMLMTLAARADVQPDDWQVLLVEAVLKDVTALKSVEKLLLGAGFRPKIIRQAQSRHQLTTFYTTHRRRNLYQAVWLDPRWLLNRGVLAQLNPLRV